MIRIGIDLIQIVHKSGEPRIERHSHLTHFAFNLKHRKISTFANLRLGHGPPPRMGQPIRIPFCLSCINHTLHTSCKSSSLVPSEGLKNTDMQSRQNVQPLQLVILFWIRAMLSQLCGSVILNVVSPKRSASFHIHITLFYSYFMSL